MNTKIPFEILKHKPPRTTITFKDGIYYLYKTTSKRVPGMKYPQATKTYIGTIDESGINYGKIKIDPNNLQVYEYGYSVFIYHTCSKTKDRLKNRFVNFDDIFKFLISGLSFNSFFDNHSVIITNININYWTEILREEVVGLNENLEPLKKVYKVISDSKDFIVYMDKEAKKILHKYGVVL